MILGSSDYGAQIAAHFGLPYAYAYFFADGAGAEVALDIYRASYRASARHPVSHAALCVFALAADSSEEAEFEFGSRARFRLLRERGIFRPLDPPAVAAAAPTTPAEAARLAQLRAGACLGSGPEVARQIAALARRLAVDEIAVVTWAYEESVRHKSYRLLAEAMGFAPPAAPTLNP